MSDQKLKIAVFIDFDNVEIGVKTTLGLAFDIGAVLEAIKERGEVITKVAYGDWKRSGDHGRAMAQHAVRLVQRVMTPGGDKNGADINLALDALEMAFTHSHINAFVIVGGDSDFITLVEKLKQYDRKVFVVGGRAFTSQVMQKNCTEFIAYENIVPERDRRSSPKQERGERPRSSSTQPIEQAVPLVKRALKVLADREVSPQLGLLKSTLLQLDSSFSERDYGVSSFRDFADKLAQQGLVALKHQGRSTLVELSDGTMPAETVEPDPGSAHPSTRVPPASPDARSLRTGRAPFDSRASGDAGGALAQDKPGSGPTESVSSAREAGRRAARELFESPDVVSTNGPPPLGRTQSSYGVVSPERPSAAEADHEAPEEDAPRRDAPDAASLGEGVALVRRVLADLTTPPRWPMYPRQFKQFLKTAQPDFEERRYGSIADLMRACQKDGILRLERDRQGGLRVFANGATSSRASVPHGWGLVVNNPQPPADAIDPAELVEPLPPVIADPIVVAETLGIAAEPAKPKRATRARKTVAAGEKKKAAPRKKKTTAAS